MRPYISIIVASRNDDRSGALITRMQLFLENLFRQLSTKSVHIELIIVEWNPPTRKKRLQQSLSFTNKPKSCSLRIISVPSSIHKQFANADKISLFQFIAKNAGIRRATGEYILSTNIDILFSDEIIDLLLSNNLQSDLIRAVRFDIPSTIVKNRIKNNINEVCQKQVFRAFWPWGTEELTKDHAISWQLKNQLKRIFYKRVFTNACGDFTLLPKKEWNKLKGYPEYPYHGFKIDSLLVHAAISNGIKQKILFPPYSIYHIDHVGSWREQKSFLFQKKLQAMGTPFISTPEYNNQIRSMYNSTHPISFNDSHWGLANKKLPEYLL